MIATTNMAKISDLALKHQLFLRTYSFRRIDSCPWTRLDRPLAKCLVALVTTAAFYDESDAPFDPAVKGGDPSYRVLSVRNPDGSSAAGLKNLRIGHRSTAFDATGIERDFNLALPVDRFLELERDGLVGQLHDQALSFMGSITAPGRLMKETAPQAAGLLKAQAVDVAFLTPV